MRHNYLIQLSVENCQHLSTFHYLLFEELKVVVQCISSNDILQNNLQNRICNVSFVTK